MDVFLFSKGGPRVSKLRPFQDNGLSWGLFTQILANQAPLPSNSSDFKGCQPTVIENQAIFREIKAISHPIQPNHCIIISNIFQIQHHFSTFNA